MSAADRVHSYANAFYEAATDRWLAALDGVAAQMAQDPGLQERLEPSDGDAARAQRLVDGLLPSDVDLPVRNLLYTLAQADDLAALPEIVDALRQKVLQASQGPLEVEVTSAVDLTEQERQNLMARLEAQFGKNIDVRYRKDPAILGGMVIRAGDKLIDGSVATRLQEMRQALGVAARE